MVALVFQYGLAPNLDAISWEYFVDAWTSGCGDDNSSVEVCSGNAGVFRAAGAAFVFYFIFGIGEYETMNYLRSIRIRCNDEYFTTQHAIDMIQLRNANLPRIERHGQQSKSSKYVSFRVEFSWLLSNFHRHPDMFCLYFSASEQCSSPTIPSSVQYFCG